MRRDDRNSHAIRKTDRKKESNRDRGIFPLQLSEVICSLGLCL